MNNEMKFAAEFKNSPTGNVVDIHISFHVKNILLFSPKRVLLLENTPHPQKPDFSCAHPQTCFLLAHLWQRSAGKLSRNVLCCSAGDLVRKIKLNSQPFKPKKARELKLFCETLKETRDNLQPQPERTFSERARPGMGSQIKGTAL